MINSRESSGQVSDSQRLPDQLPQPNIERTYFDQVLGVVTPACGELTNGHLQELLASIAACRDQDKVLNIIVVNNTELAARLDDMLNSLCLLDRASTVEHFTNPRNISDFFALYKRSYSSLDEHEQSFLSTLQYAQKPQGDVIADFVERYRENQLSIGLIRIISQASFQMKRIQTSPIDKGLIKNRALKQMEEMWNLNYPSQALPYGFEIALRRMINVEVIDQSSLGLASEYSNIGRARDVGGKHLFKIAPRCLAVYFRDADTLLTDKMLSALISQIIAQPQDVVRIPHRLRPSEPTFPAQASTPANLDSLIRKVMTGTFTAPYGHYALNFCVHDGGSQLCIPKELFDITGYPEGAGSEDFAMSAIVSGNSSHPIRRPLRPGTGVILKNRVGPHSFDGNNWEYFQDSSILGSHEAQTRMVSQIQRWIDDARNAYQEVMKSEHVSEYILATGPLGFYSRDQLLSHLMDNEILEARHERARWRSFARRLLNGLISVSLDENDKIGELPPDVLSGLKLRQRSFLESNPLIWQYLREFFAKIKDEDPQRAWQIFKNDHSWFREDAPPDMSILDQQKTITTADNIYDYLWIVGFKEKLKLILHEAKDLNW